MNESENPNEKPVPREFMEELGFELPEEVFSFYIEGSDIVFNLQIVEEIGCNIQFSEQQEKFPLSEEQIQMLKDANYYSTEGRLIL